MSERLVGSRVPDLRQVLVDLVLRYRMKRGGGRPLTPEGMKRNAVRFERANAKVPVPPFVAIESADVGAVSGEWVSMRDQAEQTSSRGVILYFHGGGFVMGSPQTHRVVTWRLARATGRRVLAIAYRKAPDHAFPAWVDDGVAAFQWLVDRGYAAKDILLAGDSAGGNLALAVAHRLRREARPLPGGMILFSPWADLACEAKSYRKNRRSDAMFHAKSVRETGAFLTRGADPKHPEASPVHADLAGFPPMLLFAGTRELFVDDARTIARHATASGVRADLHVYRHMPHVFPLLVGVLPRAKPAYETITRFVQETQR
ncbi:MAG TPA: alpha/beta hydrolase [Polyangiaceae bacterium]|jgi:monoterpene epsilon-lactone hydrolase